MHRVVALFVAGVALSGCGGTSTTTSSPSPATETTTPPATSTAAARPALTEAALDGLLLTPAEADAATGLSGLSVAATANALATDIQLPPDAAPEKLACVGIAGTAEAQAYEGSGAAGVRDQLLRSSGADGAARTAAQSVILFDTPARASAFVDSSAEKWPLCREFSGADSTSTVGEVATDDGVVRATITATNAAGDTVTCRRALTAANNAVIEGSACGAAASDAAVAIVREIAAKANG